MALFMLLFETNPSMWLFLILWLLYFLPNCKHVCLFRNRKGPWKWIWGTTVQETSGSCLLKRMTLSLGKMLSLRSSSLMLLLVATVATLLLTCYSVVCNFRQLVNASRLHWYFCCCLRKSVIYWILCWCKLPQLFKADFVFQTVSCKFYLVVIGFITGLLSFHISDSISFLHKLLHL